MHRMFAIAFLALGVSACDGKDRSAIAPSPIAPLVQPAPPPAGPNAVLFGVVSVRTAAGRIPLSGVEVEVAVCPQAMLPVGSYVRVVTGVDGSYRVPGMCAGETYFWVSKPGYATEEISRQCDGGCLYAVVNGDTRVDIDLLKL